MNPGYRPLGVLFDLDGTLVDTAPDMAAALNRLLEEDRRPTLPFEAIRPQVSNGARGLLGLAYRVDTPHPEYEPLRQRFLDAYQSDLSSRSRLFEGMETVLQVLETQGIAWGIVTNKPGWLTDPLVRDLGIQHRARCVVSGDTCERAKPHPMPLLHAAEILGMATAACLYIGDAARDIEAARAAGMPVIGASYGYIEPGMNAADWGADALAAHPLEILTVLGLDV